MRKQPCFNGNRAIVFYHSQGMTEGRQFGRSNFLEVSDCFDRPPSRQRVNWAFITLWTHHHSSTFWLAFIHKQQPLIGHWFCGQQCSAQLIPTIPAISKGSAVATANLLAIRHFAHQVLQRVHLRFNAQCRWTSQWSRSWRLTFPRLHWFHGGRQSVGTSLIKEFHWISSVQIFHDGILPVLLWFDQATVSFTPSRIRHLHDHHLLLVYLHLQHSQKQFC